MRIVTGIPTFNEIEFIDQSVNDALLMGYDTVVYLDDGSTDGTYERLIDYSKKFPIVKVFRTDKNSILNKGVNRWKVLAEHCREFDPDWIMVRATDQTFSAPSRKLLRLRLEKIMTTDTIMVSFPVVHFWRSKQWFRSDGMWGHAAYNHVSESCWRNDSGWEFIGDYEKAVLHRGGHKPNKYNRPVTKCVINSPQPHKTLFPISVLHYGMASHNLIVQKLERQLNIAKEVGGIGIPGPAKMPHPLNWQAFNGYKIAYEKDINFTKAPMIWFDYPFWRKYLLKADRPKVESIYNMLVKYNKEMAEEYAKIYGR